VLLVVVVLGGVVYLTVRFFERRRSGGDPRPPRTSEPRPQGPDDDPDFRREIDKRKHHPEDPDASG